MACDVAPRRGSLPLLTRAEFPLLAVLHLRVGDGLPLHVAPAIDAAGGQRRNVVDHLAAALAADVTVRRTRVRLAARKPTRRARRRPLLGFSFCFVPQLTR